MPAGLVSESQIAHGLAALGVAPGDVVLAHTSLKSMGYVVGGPASVVRGLLAAVGERGTVVMPSFSTYLSHPSSWHRHPVPAEAWATVAANVPAYSRRHAPADAGLGIAAEVFR